MAQVKQFEYKLIFFFQFCPRTLVYSIIVQVILGIIVLTKPADEFVKFNEISGFEHELIPNAESPEALDN